MLVVVVIEPACTVAPAEVQAVHASFGDSGRADSGFIAFTADGAIIDHSAAIRYRALLDLYGHAFLPPLEHDYGLTDLGDGRWHLTNDALAKFSVMNRWRRMGRPPP